MLKIIRKNKLFKTIIFKTKVQKWNKINKMR